MERRDSPLILSILIGLVLLASVLVACSDGAADTPVIPQSTDAFEPTSEPNSAIPYVHQSGSTVLSTTFNAVEREIEDPTAYLDLDTGSIGDTVAGDIRFDFGGGSDIFYSLDPVNGAENKRVGETEPGFEGCQAMIDSLTEGIAEAFPNEYSCVLTNQGRLAQVRVDALNPWDMGSIQVSFTTWEKADGE